MTDPSGRTPMPAIGMPGALLSMAEAVAEAMGRFHPGRPAFSALSRAEGALRLAAQEVEIARRTYAPESRLGAAEALSTASRSRSQSASGPLAHPVNGRGREES